MMLKTPLVYTTAIAYGAPNYVAQCLAAKQSGAQALIVVEAALVVQHAVADCAKQGYTPIVRGGRECRRSGATRRHRV